MTQITGKNNAVLRDGAGIIKATTLPAHARGPNFRHIGRHQDHSAVGQRENDYGFLT